VKIVGISIRFHGIVLIITFTLNLIDISHYVFPFNFSKDAVIFCGESKLMTDDIIWCTGVNIPTGKDKGPQKSNKLVPLHPRRIQKGIRKNRNHLIEEIRKKTNALEKENWNIE
jgi:hypothetical protein